MFHTVEDIEEQIKAAKEKLSFGEAINRLKGNPDFKKVFMDGFFREEAIRLVHLKADPAHRSPEQQASIDNAIQAIGYMMAFLNDKLRLSDMALNELADAEAAREEMIAEEA